MRSIDLRDVAQNGVLIREFRGRLVLYDQNLCRVAFGMNIARYFTLARRHGLMKCDNECE
jgi:hypothetical protein